MTLLINTHTHTLTDVKSTCGFLHFTDSLLWIYCSSSSAYKDQTIFSSWSFFWRKQAEAVRGSLETFFFFLPLLLCQQLFLGTDLVLLLLEETDTSTQRWWKGNKQLYLPQFIWVHTRRPARSCLIQDTTVCLLDVRHPRLSNAASSPPSWNIYSALRTICTQSSVSVHDFKARCLFMYPLHVMFNYICLLLCSGSGSVDAAAAAVSNYPK